MKKGPTEFLGMEFTLNDGTKMFVPPHSEVKKMIEERLNPLTNKEKEARFGVQIEELTLNEIVKKYGDMKIEDQIKNLKEYLNKTPDRSSGIERIDCPELLEEMRNYVPKGYKPMNDKYFVPKIEDIHVGYELQFHNSSIDERGEWELNYERWDDTILNSSNLETLLKYGIKHVRVPYLTTTQVVEEGWKYLYEPDLSMLWGSLRYEKENYLLIKDYRDCKIRIFKEKKEQFKKLSEATHDTIFDGICPSINEFRTICKLLKIN